MSTGSEKEGYLALTRFGYGPRGDGDLAAASSDPRGILKAELLQPGIALLSGPGLLPSANALQVLFADQAAKKAEKERLEKEKADKEKLAAAEATMQASMEVKPMETKSMEAGNMMQPDGATMMQKDMAPQMNAAKPAPPPVSPENAIFKAEAGGRIRRAIETRIGVAERLVAFWSNHFCIGVQKSQFARISAGAFEREAIRPHVLGRFEDMLLAVTQHPAMLHYLDIAQSIGPNSKIGQKQHRGLNENLARELMELHTLGVGGGYTQDDVTTLAKVLTGWTSVGAPGQRGEPGTFLFNADAHEPGPETLLGKTFAEGGMEQGTAVLSMLAQHPSTAHFIATKFAQHFIADQPSPALVQRLAETFRKSGGDLKALTFALIDADESWANARGKLRSPYDYLIATQRAVGMLPQDAGQILGPLNAMGMPLWAPPGPNGFSDRADAWASPEGLKVRLDYTAQWTSKMKDPPNPSDLLDAVCGSAASSDTRSAVARAESRQQGLALLLLSPEFQWR